MRGYPWEDQVNVVNINFSSNFLSSLDLIYLYRPFLKAGISLSYSFIASIFIYLQGCSSCRLLIVQMILPKRDSARRWFMKIFQYEKSISLKKEISYVYLTFYGIFSGQS